MRVLAHISDLHFGTEIPTMVRTLKEDLEKLHPDVIAVSGDLSQRARESQFLAARRFLNELPFPQVIVPGNHDIPLFNLPVRLLNPLGRYRKHISWDLAQTFVDSEVAVFGFNTVRPGKWKSGHLGESELKRLRTFLGSANRKLFKVVVTHHPLVPFRARKVFSVLSDGGADLVLAGHLHRGVHGRAGLRRRILFAEAGTAVSTRARNEVNGYNVVTVSDDRVVVQIRAWDGKGFHAGRSITYPRASCI
ncbi:MAG: hypothetical protein A2X94_11260 [Bdellovibrionales bacterium GWB1_55_8]|nr:MAG: hypothetical protein A2X94_11260 [Bdellovibrionales bacterium GWB1_55_8]